MNNKFTHWSQLIMCDKIKPNEIGMELRVYKDDCVDGFRPPLCHEPDPQDILDIMDKIVHLNKLLERIDYKED